MSNYSYLIIDSTDFINKIQDFISEGTTLLERNIGTEEEFANFRSENDKWEKDIEDILTSSFAEKANSFYHEFQGVYGEQSFYVRQPGQEKPLEYRLKDSKETLRQKIQYLKYNLRIIKACEYIMQGVSFDFTKRAKYTIQEKLNFILETLYDLNDGYYYPIEVLLQGNGIRLKNLEDPYELVKILEDNQYVETERGLGVDLAARITSLGSMYIEKNATAHSESYDDISDDNEEINNRVDEIIEHLEKLGLGQEILFEELQELKELYGKLNKKNWGQIIKGKLLDLALAKLVENDTIGYIYRKLTGHDLRLP